MKDWLRQVTAIPWVAHILRANRRFTHRLGNQFAGAITYFSILALVPILMLAFALLGFTVTEIVPELRAEVTATISGSFGEGGAGGKIQTVVLQAFEGWPTIFGVGLLSVAYAGAGWVKNLKGAIRAQWRPEFDVELEKRNFLLELLINLGILFILLLLVGATFAISTMATGGAETLLSALGLAGQGWAAAFLRLVSSMLSVGTGWVLFLFIYRVLPKIAAPWKPVMKGALVASIGLALLQYLVGILFALFGRNAAAAVFGPVIVLMLFFNLFARLTLLVAAWISTEFQPAIAREYHRCDEPLRNSPYALIPEGHWESDPDYAPPAAPEQADQVATADVTIPMQTAERGARIALASGYVVGASTGIGVGAFIVATVKRLFSR